VTLRAKDGSRRTVSLDDLKEEVGPRASHSPEEKPDTESAPAGDID
jgi:hypothetical protein